MDELEKWLTPLGLAPLAPALRANDIDLDILPALTEQDLEKLGLSIGYRRKLLRAAASLPRSSSSSLSATLSPNAAAERRQLTVMFCDLVGSTALSARLDPEDLRDIIGTYHRCCAEQIIKSGGFVAKYMGDGVLVYFGYPHAHEDDAEQAVRAGLAVIDAVGELQAAEPLQVRIGIATGLVVVGDLIGAGSAQEQAIVGETPNLAARLQGLAGPDTIVIAESTRRQVGARFETVDLGPQPLKGFAEPQWAWRVVLENRALGRFEALRSGATPLIGRHEEMELLLRCWAQAKTGSGRVVLISAEAGVGKSRLAETLTELIAGEPHIQLRYFCSPHHQDSALNPVIAQMERAAGFAQKDSPGEKLAKLQALFVATAPPREDVALIAELHWLPSADLAPPLDVSPQRKKEKTFEALLRHIERHSEHQPVLMVFEDIHWIDPSSRELLDRTVERIANWPVLLITTFRPEFQPPWTGQPHVTMLALTRLDRRDTAAMVANIAGNDALPSEIVREIAERADGVPLFIEELTKAVLESGAEGAAALSAIPHPALSVPATLQASLMARLDRLGPAAKDVAQKGSVIGRYFGHELLASIADLPEPSLRGALDRLTNAGLVFARGTPPQSTYTFKHALVQDVAYNTLLRSRRQDLHARIGDALVLQTAKSVVGTAEVIAYHLQSAGRSEEAIFYWREAGAQAVHRAANREGIQHFRRALALIEVRPEEAERWRNELPILSQLCPALMSIHGWSAPEVGHVVERASEVARRLASSADLAPSIAALWLFNIARGRFDRAEEISEDLFRIARELDDSEVMLQAHHTAWPTRWLRGLHANASKHVDAGLAFYDEERHAYHRYVYLGHDPAVCGLAIHGVVQWALGHPARSARLEAEAVSLARRLQHAPSLAQALSYACEYLTARGDAAAVIEVATELLELSQRHGLLQPAASALMFLGWGLAHSGDTKEGIARLEEGLRIWNGMGTRMYMPRSLCLMAECHLVARRSAEGLRTVARALDIVSNTGEQCWLPRLHQARAELLLQARPRDDGAAEVSLRTAIAVAQQQGARGWELRASIRVAQLWRDQGKRTEARDLLAPIYGWFTEGFDTPDLKEAKALLEELA